MKAWLITGLLVAGIFHAVPKEAYQAKTKEDSTNNPINSPVPENKRAIPRPSPQKEQESTNNETNQPSWCERILTPVFANWPTLAVTIWGILVLIQQTRATRKAAEAARDSVRLQQAAMQQWITVTDWEARFSNEQKALDIGFRINNPTRFPLTINTAQMTLGLPGTMPITPVVPNLRLPPDIPAKVRITAQISPDEAMRFRSADGLSFSVQVQISHTDISSNNPRFFPLRGYLTCWHGNPSRAEFVNAPVIDTDFQD